MIVGFLIFAVGLGAVNGQMVRQCQCSEVEPCKNAHIDSVIPCADSCQHHAAAIGANYQALRSCLLQREPQLRAAMQCAEGRLSNSCARGGSSMVPKRYPETLKIAALAEINRMLTASGVASEVKSLMSQGKKMFSCMRSCMDRKSGGCAKRLGCGLQLPSDQVLVQNGKQCAIQSGFDTRGVQQICQCAAAAGISQLNNICPRLRIS